MTEEGKNVPYTGGWTKKEGQILLKTMQYHFNFIQGFFDGLKTFIEMHYGVRKNEVFTIFIYMFRISLIS